MRRIENQYIVKPDEGVVICKRVNHMEDYILEEIDKKCSDSVSHLLYMMYTYHPMYGLPEVEISPKHVGVAKCDPRDEFDEKIGRDVARLISAKKCHLAIIKKYKNLIKYFQKLIHELENLILPHEEKLAEICSKLDAYKE